MSVPLTINGSIFNYPQNFDTGWGVDATGWAQAVTSGMLQKAGGSFPLTADVDFGSSFGLKAAYFETRATPPATAGTIRLASVDAGIAFRNHFNNGNLILTTTSSDNLSFTNGLQLTGTLILLNNNAVSFQDVGSLHAINMKSAATTANYAFTLPPNSGASGQFLQTDGTGVTTWVNASGTGTVNSGTAGNLTYYATSTNAVSDSGIASAKVFLKDGTVSATGNFNLNSNKITNLALPTTSGDALSYGQGFSVGNNSITNLANGVNATDATAFGQVQYGFQAAVQGVNTVHQTINSASYVSAGLSATIVPTRISSRIKITATIGDVEPSASVNAFFTIFRNSTDLGAVNGFAVVGGGSVGANHTPVSLCYIDSPATTAFVTYSVQVKTNGSIQLNQADVLDTMILEELR